MKPGNPFCIEEGANLSDISRTIRGFRYSLSGPLSGTFFCASSDSNAILASELRARVAMRIDTRKVWDRHIHDKTKRR